MGKVGLNGANGKPQTGPDLSVGQPGGGERGDLAFSGRQHYGRPEQLKDRRDSPPTAGLQRGCRGSGRCSSRLKATARIGRRGFGYGLGGEEPRTKVGKCVAYLFQLMSIVASQCIGMLDERGDEPALELSSV